MSVDISGPHRLALSNDAKDRLERAFRAGVSIDDLSERFGLTPVMVKKHLRDRQIARAVAPRELTSLETKVLSLWRLRVNTKDMVERIEREWKLIVTEADCANALARVKGGGHLGEVAP